MTNVWSLCIAVTMMLASQALPSVDMVNMHSGAISECVWDGTGCYDDGCDTDQRVSNCKKFEQQDACESDTGKDSRCRWSFGDAVAEVAADLEAELQADSSGNCVWDGTGCYDDGCDPDQRNTNCGKFGQQTSCESDTGKDNRCMWSMDSSLLFGLIDFDFKMPTNPLEMTWDIMVVAAALFVFAAWVGYNFVRWCQRPKKFEYEPIYEVEMPRV